ncbi:MAG: hypothetical protein LJU34_06060 [Oscillospiraceae bacterium]|nr:hypothetical protein [Oscillospiraceae bacterium]
MKKFTKLLSLCLAVAMLLGLSVTAFAAEDDWVDYQQYVISYAEAGAPTEEDAVSMTEIIMACEDMDDIAAASEIQVFFEVLGALDYDAWVAAGQPEAGDMDSSASGEASDEVGTAEAASDEASGEASDEASSEASGETTAPAYGDLEEEAGDNAVVSYHEDYVTYVTDGEEVTVEIAEGQTAYLTVDGVNIPMAVGNYDGTVAIDVVDPIFESEDYQSSDKDVDLTTELASVIYITEDGLQESQSVLSAAVDGEITDTSVTGVTITSEDVAALSGIRAGGSATVEVSDVTITLSGEGGNDFMGQGAALCATDGATLIATNVTATVSGYVRGCTFAGGESTLMVYDSTFICDAGEYNADATVSGAAMSQPPAGLGVYGNTRLNNMVHNATEYFENCTFISRNWGCLGVDAVENGTLTCVDCSITITESGYGAYSIGACVDTFTGCTFDINNGVVAFVAADGTVILNGGTVANSNRYGIVTHQAMGYTSVVKVLGEGTELNSAYCAIMVKGRSSDIEVGDGAVLTASETGVLIQAQDNDDTGAGSVNNEALVAVSIHDTELEGDVVMSMAPAEGSTATMAVALDNATITGAVTLSNSTLAIEDGNISFDNILDVGMIENEYGPRADETYLTVTLTNGAVWNVTETSYVSELTVDETSTVNGTITEADGYYIVEPAEAAASDEASGEASTETAAAGDTSEEAYQEYLHTWLQAEDEVNETMTEDIVENEFMPLIYAGDYTTFPAEMLWGDMLETGNPMTYDEFVAAGGVY